MSGRQWSILMLRVCLGVCLGVCLWLPGANANSTDKTVEFVVFVSQSKIETERRFTPLVNYLRRVSGLPLQLVVPHNAFEHWHRHTLTGSASLVLEAAQFVDFRIKHRGYLPLVGSLRSQSYSLVTAANTVLLEPEELHGQSIAALAPPNPGPLMLFGLFSDVIARPVIREVGSPQAGIGQLLSGDVVAAVIPTDLEEGYPQLNVFITTESSVSFGISAAPGLADDAKHRLLQALLDARNDPVAQSALDATGSGGFEAVNATSFDGAARWLRGTWGYPRI